MGRGVGGGGGSQDGPSGSSLLGHSNSTLRSLAYCSTHVFVLSSSVSTSSPASLHTLFSPIIFWFVQSVCLVIIKHHHHLGIPWRIPLPLPQILPARCCALPRAWHHCKQPRCLLGFSCLASRLQGLVGFEPARFSCMASSTCSFHHQVSGLHWWFLERPQTSTAASNRGSFSFDQTVSTRFAVSAVTSAAVATAVATFNLKAN